MRERPSQAALAAAVIVAIGACTGGVANAAVRPDVLHRVAASSPVAAGAAAEAQRARAAHHSTLPHWLHDTSRNASLLQNGFLTRSVRRHVPGKVGLQSGTAAADSVCRLLLVRVGFAANRAPGLTSMHPSGDFDLEPDSTVVIDPPPHDAAYFQAHLLALTDYYRIMSNGAFRIDATVFPPAGEPSIKLADVADYGPGSNGVWTITTLEAYFRDAVALLDAEADTFDLADYDSYIIVHPGGDLQSDVRADSPNDIPTFFITLGDSIAVEGGAHEIRNGLVMPETTSQDGFIGSIQGALVHEFGHQLGLPDWYNVFTGLPTVGEWSLMDSGNAAFFAATTDPNDPDAAFFAFGLLPTGLTGYERYLLGWENPVVLQAPAQDVSLRPWWSSLDAHPSSAILPVAPEEYFFVENRRDLLTQRPDLGETEPCPYLNRDLETGVVLWMSKSDADVVPSRLRRNTGEYDFWIPSPTAPAEFTDQTPCNAVFFGLLVWHVDERPLAEGLPFNTVNVDSRYPALKLVEASGDYEIGDLINPNQGFRGDGWNDPFRQNPFVSYTRLDATSTPNNWNSDWAFTGWEITNVQDDGAESHRLSVRTEQGVAGWPALLRDAGGVLLDVDPQSALVADVGGIGRALVVADSHAVFALHAGAVQELVSGVFRPESLAHAPAFGGGGGVIAALDPDGVWVWDAQWTGGLLGEHPGFPVALPDGSGDRLVLLPDGVLAETGLGAWAELDANGTLLGTYAGAQEGADADPVVGEFDAGVGLEAAFVAGRDVVFERLGGAGQHRLGLDFDAVPGDVFTAGGAIEPGTPGAQLVVLHRDGRLRVIDRQRGTLAAWGDLPRDEYIGLALADVDGDGYADIVASATKRIIGVNGRGARLFNTPIEVRDVFALRSQGELLAPAVVADVGGDALPEYVFATDLGLIYALDVDGEPLPGFPRKALIDLLPAALVLADVDADAGTREIVGVSTLAATAVAAGGDASMPGWTEISGTAARTRMSPGTSARPEGDRLLALERPFFAYPNPTREPVVRLRITARSEGPYEIRIFNLEGEQVFQQNGIAAEGTQEVVWPTGQLASGTYLCRFVSAAAGVTSPLIEPVTLVR